MISVGADAFTADNGRHLLQPISPQQLANLLMDADANASATNIYLVTLGFHNRCLVCCWRILGTWDIDWYLENIISWALL